MHKNVNNVKQLVKLTKSLGANQSKMEQYLDIIETLCSHKGS